MTLTKEELKAIQDLNYDTGYASGRMDGRAEGIGYRLKAQLENLIKQYYDEIFKGVGPCYDEVSFYRMEGGIYRLEDVVSDLNSLLKDCDEPNKN